MLAILVVGYSFWVPVLLSCPIILGAETTKMLDIGLEKQTGSITPWTWRRNLQLTMSVCFSYTAACTCGLGVCWGSMWQAAYLLLVFLKSYLCILLFAAWDPAIRVTRPSFNDFIFWEVFFSKPVSSCWNWKKTDQWGHILFHRKSGVCWLLPSG